MLTEQELNEIIETSKDFNNLCEAEKIVPKLIAYIQELHFKLDFCACGHPRNYHTFYGSANDVSLDNKLYDGVCCDLVCDCCGFHSFPRFEEHLRCDTCKSGIKGCPFDPDTDYIKFEIQNAQ